MLKRGVDLKHPQRPVAIKVSNKSLMNDKRATRGHRVDEDVRTEVEALARLHPLDMVAEGEAKKEIGVDDDTPLSGQQHITGLVSEFEDESFHYLVTEFVEHGELHEYLTSKGTLPEEEAQTIIAQLVKAMLYVHSKGVCHLDISLENILLGEGCFVKLIDFGLCRVLTGPGLSRHSRRYSSTSAPTASVVGLGVGGAKLPKRSLTMQTGAMLAIESAGTSESEDENEDENENEDQNCNSPVMPLIPHRMPDEALQAGDREIARVFGDFKLTRIEEQEALNNNPQPQLQVLQHPRSFAPAHERKHTFSQADFDLSPAPGGVGKAVYMAPELYNCKPFNGLLADAWSLGVVLFTMLTGSMPFEEPSARDPWFRVIYAGKLMSAIHSSGHYSHLSFQAVDFLTKVLAPPDRRLTVKQMLSHPWLACRKPSPLPRVRAMQSHGIESSLPDTPGLRPVEGREDDEECEVLKLQRVESTCDPCTSETSDEDEV